MANSAARRMRILVWLAACGAAVTVSAAELGVLPAAIPAGKATTVRIDAPGPGAVLLVPGGPHVVATLTLPDNHLLGLDPQRGLGYRVAADRFEVLDLRAPDTVIGRFDADAPITAVNNQGGEALLSLADGKVVALDLRDPRTPRPRLAFKLPAAGLGIALAGQYALQASGRNELLVWDVSDPAQARLAARYETIAPAADVAVGEGRAYVALQQAGLLVLDVQDPVHPLWLGSTGRLGNVTKVVARGDSVWVATDEGVSRVNVFNAAQPGFSAKQPLPSAVTALAVAGDEAWVATADAVVRVGFDAEAPQAGNLGLDVGRGVNYGGQRRADVVGNLVYVADWFSGIHIYDVAGAQPQLLASLRTPGSAKGIVVRGDYAFVADDDHGLAVVDVRNPRVPRIAATLATRGLAYTPKLAGDLLYLASHRGGFQIIDVSKPIAPRLVAEVATPGMAWSLAVTGDTLYVADDAAGLLIYDVRAPAEPKVITHYDSGGRLEDVLVRDGRAYLAYFDQGLKILDVGMPAQPRVLAELATPGNARGLDLAGDTLYVADWLAGVHRIDVSDPAHPVARRSYDTPGAAWGVRARGDDVYVLDWWGGFEVLHLPAEGAPSLVRYAERGRPQQTAADGDYLYVAHGESGLQIFDIKNPLNPTWVTGVELPAAARGVAVTGRAAYVALAAGGLAVIDLKTPGEARLAAVVQTAQELVALHAAGTRLYARSDNQGLIFDLVRPLQPRLRTTTAAAVGELWPAADRLYVTGGAEAWRRLGVAAAEPPQPARLLRGRNDLVATLDDGRDGAVTLYRVMKNRWEKLGAVNLGRRIVDLAWGDDVLYASGELGLVTLDVRDPRRPEIVAMQNGFAAAGGIISHRGVLYNGLDALRPPPPLGAAIDKRGSADLTVTADLPVGGYDLLYKSAHGEAAARHNALKVETLRFSKPNITPEQFQRLLQQYRSNDSQTPVKP